MDPVDSAETIQQLSLNSILEAMQHEMLHHEAVANAALLAIDYRVGWAKYRASVPVMNSVDSSGAPTNAIVLSPDPQHPPENIEGRATGRYRYREALRRYRRGAVNQELGSNWQFVNRLGRGAHGWVSLWRRNDLSRSVRMARTTPLHIAMKEFTGVEGGFGVERGIMLELQSSGVASVPHVVHLSEHFESTDQRLYLDYCSGGSLQSLLFRMRKMNRPLFERTLWEFFGCFARGLSIMNHGNESVKQDPGVVGVARNPKNTGPLCHHDIKPANILLDDSRMHRHPDQDNQVPILRVADFGCALYMDWRNKNYDVEERFSTRNIGTYGYLAPESFSEKWDLLDYDGKYDEVGNWGTHTNIWQIAVVMYQLMTLGPPPQATSIYVSSQYPDITGPTYGEKLRDKFTMGPGPTAIEYSPDLKRLVFRCLMREIEDRMTLRDLHQEITLHCNAFNRHVNAAGEHDIGQREPSDENGDPYVWNVQRWMPQAQPIGTRDLHDLWEGGLADPEDSSPPGQLGSSLSTSAIEIWIYYSQPLSAHEPPDRQPRRLVVWLDSNKTLGELKAILASSKVSGGLGMIRETLSITSLDSEVPAELGHAFDGWTLADCGIEYMSMLHVEGEEADSSSV